MKPGDVVELPDGRRLMTVSPERAAEICKDVQLWYFRGRRWEKDADLLVYRRNHWHLYPSNFMLARAIELDPDKEEYVCGDSPSPS